MNDLKTHEENNEHFIHLYVRDGPFVAEVGAMGHGLQMWLQVMWFLARTLHDSPVILDEPDVYMHPDLQRRLIRLVRGRFVQTIIATHSIEMMSEVEPQEVVIVDKSRRHSRPADSLPAVQRIAETIGSVHNLQLTRLWSSRKCLLVEGEDLGFLKVFQNLLFPTSTEPIDAIPNMDIGGWGNWSYAVGSSMLLKNAAGNIVKVYCILDRDYYPDQIIAGMINKAQAHGVELHVWNRKEIESYLLVPRAIARCLASKNNNGNIDDFEIDVRLELNRIAEELREDCTDKIAQQLSEHRIAKGLAQANKLAREIVANAWTTGDCRFYIVSAKDVLSRLSSWSQKKYKCSLSANRLARNLLRGELDREVVRVLQAVEYRSGFLEVPEKT